MKVNDILKLLSKPEKLRLDYMFEKGDPDYIIMLVEGQRWFVGVHLYTLDHLIKIDTDGAWSIGKL